MSSDKRTNGSGEDNAEPSILRFPVQSPALDPKKPAFSFEHPAAPEVRELLRELNGYTENDHQNLPRRDRYVFDVFWFETEVMNGGVDQYLGNCAGDYATECLEALKAIGAGQSYWLLKQACDLFPKGQPSKNQTVRRNQLRKLAGSKHIDDLIEGEIEVNLYQLLLDFYQAHAEAR